MQVPLAASAPSLGRWLDYDRIPVHAIGGGDQRELAVNRITQAIPWVLSQKAKQS
jgi:hypothetical protein